jgi:hypothetical protein
VTAEAPEIVRELELVGELPHGDGEDHAEGIALVGGRLLVVYDSPAEARHTPAGGMLADLITLP